MDKEIKKKTTKKKAVIRALLAAGITLAAIGLAAVLIIVGGREIKNVPQQLVYSLEAGETPDIPGFLQKEGLKGELSGNSVYDQSIPGDYELTVILSDGEERKVLLKVRDNTAPSYIEMPPMLIKRGTALTPDMLLPSEYIKDATPVKCAFLSSGITAAKAGLNTVSLRLTDGGGNTTVAKVSFFVTDTLNAGYYYEIGSAAPSAEDLAGSGFALKKGENPTAEHPGFITVHLTKGGKEYILRCEAKDTIKPEATLIDDYPTYYVGDRLPDPMSFFDSVHDMTEVTARYAEEYLLDRAELKQIAIVLTDEGGNSLQFSVSLPVLLREDGSDKLPPVISGVRNLTTEAGVKPDYLSGVSVFDGRDGIIGNENIILDTSKVNLTVVSSGLGYPVVYTVYDRAGNMATATAYVRVIESTLPAEEADIYFKQIVNELNIDAAQSRMSVLSGVYELLAGSYRLEKGEANSDLSDYRKEAYWGFRLKKGNCETACAMLSVILDELDIEYIKVYRNALDGTKHCWLLVDYGIGWLYMDCLPTYGYIWTLDGRFLRADSPEAEQLSAADERKREAMTTSDIDELTALSNQAVVGWNYYRTDTSGLPETAEKLPSGQYRTPKYTVTYSVNQSIYGSIYGQTNQTVSHGGRAGTVTAVAKSGYKFVCWSDGSTEASRSDVIKRDTALVAEFEPDGQTVSYFTVIYTADIGGSIEGSAVQESILYGQRTSSVTAIPDEGYYFIGWEDGVTTASRTDVVREDVTYKALFAPKTVLIYLAGPGGSIEGEPEQKVIPGTSGKTVTAVPDKGYLFVSWNDGLLTPDRTDAGNESGGTFSAIFIKDEASYTVKYLCSAGGKIIGISEQTQKSGESTQKVTAQPDDGYLFVSWDDGVAEEERSDTVYENAVYTAIFEKRASHTVVYAASDGGKVEGQTEQTVYDGEQTETVVAAADEGYVFEQWTDGCISAERQDTPTEDLVLIALFRKVQ